MKVRIETDKRMLPVNTTIIIDDKDISEIVENFKIETDRNGLTRLVLHLVPSTWEIEIKERKE